MGCPYINIPSQRMAASLHGRLGMPARLASCSGAALQPRLLDRLCRVGHRRRSLHASSTDATTWDDSASTLADLRVQLGEALKVEDYAQAARLRDTIQRKQVDSKLAVEDANKQFYDAFMSGSVQAMSAVWGTGEHVQVIHPGCNCIAGREAVMESWRAILAGVRPRAFRIKLDDVRVYAADDHGFVTCVEVVDADESEGRICATNIFEKQGDKWVLVFHQGGPAPLTVRAPRRRGPL